MLKYKNKLVERAIAGIHDASSKKEHYETLLREALRKGDTEEAAVYRRAITTFTTIIQQLEETFLK